jgi:hypothetical protein
MTITAPTDTDLEAAIATVPRSPREVDLIHAWLRDRDAEKKGAKTYHGDRPCLPAKAMMAVAERIWRKRAR